TRQSDGLGQPFPETNRWADLGISRQLLKLGLRCIAQNIHDVRATYPLGVVKASIIMPALLQLLNTSFTITPHIVFGTKSSDVSGTVFYIGWSETDIDTVRAYCALRGFVVFFANPRHVEGHPMMQ